MGGGKGGSSSQTVSIPPEVLARYNAVNARAENVAQTPFTPYSTDPNAFVAQLSGSQKSGIANINAQQGAANQAVGAGQDLQGQGIDTAQRAQAQAQGIDLAALQGISQAQQQGTAYNQAAGKNIGQAMSSAAPYMQGMAGLTQAGLGQGQQYLGGATGLTQQAIQTGQQYAGQAQPYYIGALQAAQPLNQQAQQYMQAGTQAVNPEALNYSQYMNPYMKDVVQAQQALQSQENAAQRSAMQGKAIQAGAFGGDRAGIEQANLARQQSLANQATMANLLQSGYGQAQAAAQQQQGVGLGAAQANRAAQQQAAQQAAALGQQQYGQTMGVGTGLAALGQQQYGQALGTGAQIGQLGQQGYAQNLGAGAQLGQVGQQLYAQNIGQGQAIQGLGQQQYAQGLGGSQAAAGIGQNMYGMGAQTAGLQQAGGMNIANLGMQNQAAQIAAAQAQMAAGQQQQQTEQAGKTALYNQFLQQQGYPFQIAQFLANIAEGTGSLSGSTTTAQRTGQRGGRMGDGYASGGLVPPDSQGGAVYEPGLYGRGGYADGGWTQTSFANNFTGEGDDVWTNSETGETTNTNPIETARIAKENATKEATTPADPSKYDQLIRNAYGQIGRKDIGTAANTIDQGGYDYWMDKLKSGNLSPEQFNAQFTEGAKAYNAAVPNSDIAKLTQPIMQKNADYQAVSGLNPDIAKVVQEATGKEADPASAQKYQDMLNAGMSMDQIKYNIEHSQPALLKQGDVGALKGQSLAFDPSKFTQPAGVTYNQNGSYSAGDFTPQNTGYNRPQNFGIPQNYGGYGNMSAMQGGYGGYGGGYGQQPGYGQPSNYGMPNFGSSPQYGGAPDYAGAGMYGAQQYNMFQQQQAPQASGKGAAPAPQATGKGSQPPQASGKGMSTGGRAGFADGGRIGYAGGGDPSSVLRSLAGQYDPGDPQGLVARQAAMFAGAPGAGAGYVPAVSGGGQRQMLQPQRSILPEQKSGIKEAIGMGTSIASLGEAGNKLYDKLKGPAASPAPDMGSLNNAPLPMARPVELGGLNPDAGSSLASLPDLTGGSADWSSLFGGFAANGGRIGYSAGGIPGLDDLKQGQAGIPGGEGLETPMSKVVSQGTQTPAELKGQMNSMSSGAGGLGGGSGGGGIGSAIGTAAWIVSLGNAAMSAGSWIGANVLPALMAFSDKRMKTDIKPIGKTFDGQTIHRYKYKGDPKTQIGLIAQEVEKAHPNAVGLAGGMKTVNYDTATREAAKRGHFADGGSAMLDLENPQDQAMAEAFDNLLQRYDNNPLLAAAAMDVGTKAVDAAIMKAEQTGGDITDFLPRRTQEYMFALSKAAMGAHDAMSREARAAGGRTGYAFGSVAKGLVIPDDNASPTDFDVAPTPSGDTLLAANYANTQNMGDPRASDWVEKNITTVKTPNDQKWSVHRQAAPDFQNFLEELHASGYAPVSSGGYNLRNIRGTNQLSQHAFGNAIDINAPANPQGGTKMDLPANVGELAAKHNLEWGGNWENNPDPMHFEWKGPRDQEGAPTGVSPVKPTQVATATGLAPKTDAGPFERTIGKAMPDSVPTDSSFWVPLIAGLGTMLASDKYRFSQRLGEGLVGGAAAYGKSQEFGQKEQQLAQQAAQNAALMGLKKQELGFTEREVALKEAEQKRKIDAAKAAASALTGNVPPPVVPTAKPNAGASAPSTTIGGTGTPAPVVERQTPAVGGTSTQAAAETAPEAPIPAPNSSFWANVHPQSNPHNLDEMANRFDQAAAAAAEDPSSMAAYRTSAQQYRAQANAIRQSGIVTMKDQSTASMPGFNEAKAAQAAALEKAKLDVTTSPGARAAEVEKQRLLEEEKQRYAPFEDSEGNQWRRAAPSDTPVQMAATPNTTAAAGEPVKASLDPKTARVNNVIPTPPAGGGIPQPTPPREGLVLAKSAGLSPAAKANDQKFAEEFPGKLHNAIEGEEAMQTVAQAFKLFNSNVLTEKLQGYALLARATGMPDSVVEAVAGGDPAAMQRVDKEAVPSVIGILKEGASRFGQQEFMVTQKTAVASKTAEPKANHALVGELLGKAQWNRQFLTDWDKAKDEGWRSPSAFFASWSQSNPLNTYILSATKQIGNFRGMDLPKDPNAYVEGAIYVAPERFGTPALEKYFGSIGVKPGQLFRYNGPDNLQPIAKEDHYTAHLTRRQ